MMWKSACLVATALVAQSITLSPAVAQQAFPNRPIKMIVPFPPGGVVDPLLRALNVVFQERTGQPLVVENKPGGATIIGATACKEAAPDGYTFCILSNASFHTNPLLYKKVPYQSDRDFEPVLQLMANTALIVHASVPVKTMRELVKYSQENPDKLNYAHFGAGGDPHLVLEWFKNKTGLKATPVPYRGGGEAMMSFESAQVHLMFPVIGSGGFLDRIKSGKARAIVAAGDKRSRQLPDVPTFAEEGFADLKSRTWFGLFAPAGTPKHAIDKVHAEFMHAMRQDSFREKVLFQMGLDLVDGTPESFKAALPAERQAAQELIKVSGVEVEQ